MYRFTRTMLATSGTPAPAAKAGRMEMRRRK